MPLGVVLFQALLIRELRTLIRIGTGLGPSFSNVQFANLIRREFPGMSIQEAGQAASFAIRAAKSGARQTSLTGQARQALNDIPGLSQLHIVLDLPNTIQYRVSWNFTDPITGKPTERWVDVQGSVSMTAAQVRSRAASQLRALLKEYKGVTGFGFSDVDDAVMTVVAALRDV